MHAGEHVLTAHTNNKKMSKSNKFRTGEVHTSELKASEMTRRATEQSVPRELLLEPGIVDQGSRQGL